MDRGDSIAWIAGESRYAHQLVELEHRAERASVWSAVEARGESLAIIKRVSTPTANTLRAWATSGSTWFGRSAAAVPSSGEKVNTPT